jgi:glycosyltransferase involved in cell wall biosynthesis
MKRLPSISLVTCSYQQARFLDQAIRSVRAQHYPNLEYILIDGGSTDGSRGIIARHVDALSYWVSEPDQGQTHALVKGFTRASGDVCGWLCSDDLLLPGTLQRVGEYFRDHPEVEAVFGDSIWIDAEGKPLRPKREMGFNRFVFLYDYNYVPQPSMFWRRGLYERVGGLCQDFDMAMDNDLWERFSAATRIAHIPHYLACMRFYPEQKTSAPTLREHGRREGQRVLERASPITRSAPVRAALQVLARGMRIVQKGIAGGYTASVPQELLPWLEAHSTPGLR